MGHLLPWTSRAISTLKMLPPYCGSPDQQTYINIYWHILHIIIMPGKVLHSIFPIQTLTCYHQKTGKTPDLPPDQQTYINIYQHLVHIIIMPGKVLHSISPTQTLTCYQQKTGKTPEPPIWLRNLQNNLSTHNAHNNLVYVIFPWYLWNVIMLVNQISVPSFCDVLALSFDSLPQSLGNLSIPYPFSYGWCLLLCY